METEKQKNIFTLIKWWIRIALICLISGILAVLTFFRVLLLFIKKGPTEMFKRTKRNTEPACLSDPTLGEHGFLHLEVFQNYFKSSNTIISRVGRAKFSLE